MPKFISTVFKNIVYRECAVLNILHSGAKKEPSGHTMSRKRSTIRLPVTLSLDMLTDPRHSFTATFDNIFFTLTLKSRDIAIAILYRNFLNARDQSVVEYCMTFLNATVFRTQREREKGNSYTNFECHQSVVCVV